MTRSGFIPPIMLVAAVLVAAVLGAPAPSWALSPDSSVAVGIAREIAGKEAQARAALELPPADDSEGLSDATKQGIGCLAAGGATMAYAVIWAGATETLLIAAGGMLLPSAASTLWLGLVSTVAAATCSLGATATPVVLWAIEQKDNIVANLTWQLEQTETELARLLPGPAPAGSRQLAERSR